MLPRNLEAARRQFAQVKLMLSSFERYFGPYPFPQDGYKLVECPHSGMEHQSCVAYGNFFANGYRYRSSSAEGLLFDFIIVHESAHEWWGNSVTAADIADMWIHESFGAYAEALYVEDHFGRAASLRYVNAKKQNVRNDAPMQGPYGVNKGGSGDMYDKGQLVLNTLRSAIHSDSVWFSILRGLQKEFRWKTVNYEMIVNFISARTGMDLHPFFDQYFRHEKLPRLTVAVTRKGTETTARYRLEADVPDLTLPAELAAGDGTWIRVQVTPTWQTVRLASGFDPMAFKIADDRCYFDVRIIRSFLDPAAPRAAKDM